LLSCSLKFSRLIYYRSFPLQSPTPNTLQAIATFSTVVKPMRTTMSHNSTTYTANSIHLPMFVCTNIMCILFCKKQNIPTLPSIYSRELCTRKKKKDNRAYLHDIESNKHQGKTKQFKYTKRNMYI
jgi:hypothetical protein